MVKKLKTALLCIFPLILALSGCQFFKELFALSPFPAYLAQAVASVDMKVEIEKYVGEGETDWRSDVHVLKNLAGYEYVFLIIRREFGGQRVFALDTSLNLVSHGTIDDHNDLNLVDANDNYIVGNIEFTAPDMTPISNFPDIGFEWEAGAFSNQLVMGNFVVRRGFDIHEHEIECTQYSNLWLLPATFYKAIGATDMWLRGFGYDPASQNTYLMLVGWEPSQETEFLKIVMIPASEYPSFPLATTSILNDYAVSSPVYDVREHRRFHYTRKGVVAPSHDRGRFYLVTLDGNIKKTFSISAEDEPSLDFDIDGDYYYIFDESGQRLYKASTGF